MLHQIQVAIYHPEVSKKTLLTVLDSKMTPFWSHVTPDPGGDLPSKGVQKGTHFGPRLQNVPFWSHVTPDPGCDLPSRGVQKRAPPKRTLLGVPVFGPVLPRSSCNLPQNMVPGPKSTFWTMSHDFQGTIYKIRWSSTFFYLEHFLDTFGL